MVETTDGGEKQKERDGRATDGGAGTRRPLELPAVEGIRLSRGLTKEKDSDWDDEPDAICPRLVI